MFFVLVWEGYFTFSFVGKFLRVLLDELFTIFDG